MRLAVFLLVLCGGLKPSQLLGKDFARAQDSNSSLTLEQQIRIALEQGATSEADSDLDRFLSQERHDSGALLRVGITFARKGRYSEASRVFARSIHENPADFEGHYNLALTELAQNRLDEAYKTIEQAPHASKQDSTARIYLRGKIETEMGQSQAAGRDLAAAFENDPGNENYALDLGLLDLKVHAYPQAERVFARSAEMNPRSTYLLLGLALAQFLDGRASQSAESSRRLLAMAPDFSTARLLLGFTLYFEGDLDGARRVAQEGLDLPDPNPYLYYLDAVVLLKQQNQTGESKDHILTDLASAEKTLPSCALCFVASGKAREKGNDLRRALSDFQTAVRLAPALSEGWYHLAATYERLGKTTEAEKARQHFQHLKVSEDDREKEMMRSVFLRSLGGQDPSH